MHALGFGSEYSVRGRVREHRGCEEGPPRIDRPGRLTGRKGVARPAWPVVSRIVRAPFQLWRKMLTAALHFLVASGQPTAHVTRPAFSMPAVSLPLTPHALCLACQRSSYRSMSMRMVLMTMTMTTTTTTPRTTTRLKPAVHPPHSFNESWQIRWNCSFRKELFCLLPCWGHCHVGNKRECGVGGGDRGRPWSSQARQQSLTTVSLAG